MLEELKDRTIVSWGGYQYFGSHQQELEKLVKIDYICADRRYMVATASSYTVFADRKEILYLKNPYVIISLAKDNEVAEAAEWCRENAIPYTHISFLLNGGAFETQYIKAIGGIYTDLRQNTLQVDAAAQGNIILNTRESRNACLTVGAIRVSERLYIKAYGSGGVCTIGDGTTMDSVIINVNSEGLVEIGKDCMFAHAISLHQSDQHMIFDMYTGERTNLSRPIRIGNHVWVGRECTILAGADIGDNAVVGSQAVTSGQFAPNTVIAGSPAKVLREHVIWARDLVKENNGITQFKECRDQKALDYLSEADQQRLKDSME